MLHSSDRLVEEYWAAGAYHGQEGISLTPLEEWLTPATSAIVSSPEQQQQQQQQLTTAQQEDSALENREAAATTVQIFLTDEELNRVTPWERA